MNTSSQIQYGLLISNKYPKFFQLLCDEMEQANERERKLEMKLDQIKNEKGAMLSGDTYD